MDVWRVPENGVTGTHYLSRIAFWQTGQNAAISAHRNENEDRILV